MDGGWVNAATVRFLERHETYAHAVGGREVRDLGDGLLLHDPADADPFWNRLAATLLPYDTAAFDRRIGELLTIFATLERRPHLVTPPAYVEPPDLAVRLARSGFRDLGGGQLMVLTHPAATQRVEVPERLQLECHVVPPADERARIADEAAAVLVAAFRVDPMVRPRLAADLVRSFDSPALAVHLVRAGGTVVGVAKRTSFDGASYLSSIGTRPGWEGRGIGAAVTAAACRDAAREGHPLTYLDVFAGNVRARTLYERLGFSVVGDRIGDFMLA